MTIALPIWALNEEVTVEYNADELPNTSGQILVHNDDYIILEAKTRIHLIPWTAIAYLWIPKVIPKKMEEK